MPARSGSSVSEMSEPRIVRRDEPHTLVIDGLVSRRVEREAREGPLEPLLEEAGPEDAADHGTVMSGDGHFTASIPLAFLARSRLENGRLWVPDAPTHCWDVKDVIRIELTAGRQPDTVPDYD